MFLWDIFVGWVRTLLINELNLEVVEGKIGCLKTI